MKNAPKGAFFASDKLVILTEREGCSGLLIAQLFFTNMFRLKNSPLCRSLGRTQNLEAMLANGNLSANRMNTGRKKLLRDRVW